MNREEEEDEPSSSSAAAAEIVNDANIILDDDDDSISLTVLQALTSALSNNQHGSLLRHEFAYVLGQLRDVRAVHSLECILLNEHDDTMVGVLILFPFCLAKKIMEWRIILSYLVVIITSTTAALLSDFLTTCVCPCVSCPGTT